MIDIENHKRAFPNTAIHEVGGRVYGHWFIGHDFRNKSGYYGAYPPHFLDRVFSLFPKVSADNTLHLFSGMVDPYSGWTFDVKPSLRPDIVGDAHEVGKFFGHERFDLVIADPPYSKEHAKQYGTGLPLARKVLAELFKIVKPGGYCCWLSTKAPMYSRVKRPEWEMAGLIMVYVGTNKDYRGLMILRRL